MLLYGSLHTSTYYRRRALAQVVHSDRFVLLLNQHINIGNTLVILIQGTYIVVFNLGC